MLTKNEFLKVVEEHYYETIGHAIEHDRNKTVESIDNLIEDLIYLREVYL